MRNACVIGHPVGHSLSPKLHGYWLKKYDIAGSYIALDVLPEDLAEVIEKLPVRYAGGNITIPYKEAVTPLLDEIDDVAKTIGAVNTVIVTTDGKRVGSNTDAFGFMQNIKAHTALEGRKRKAVVLGAGGAAKAVMYALIKEGYSEIHIANRTREKADAMKKQFGAKVTVFDWDARNTMLKGAGLLVNTTSLGLKNNPPLNISLASLPKDAIVTDIVYTPLITPLLAQAKAAGYEIVDGLGMLIYQAVPGFEAWFGKRPHVTKELREYLLS